MTVHLRFFLIALMVQASAPTLVAADGTGWFEEGCSSTTIHINKIGDVSISQELILRLARITPVSIYMTGADWWEVQAMRCSVDGKCEDATNARIWLNKGQGKIKRISGRYTVDFSAQPIEGQFLVNYRKHQKPLICE